MSVFSDPQSRGFARVTGLFYLSVAFIGPFAILYVPAQIGVPGDAAATLNNLIAKRGLFMAGAGGEAAIMLIEVVLAALLYTMFRVVNPTLSAMAGLARFGEAAVMGAMLLFSAAALSVADPATAFGGIDEVQRAGLAATMVHAHDAGVWVWQLFFALHLAILGQLVARSGLYPRLIGHAMTLGSVGYVLDTMSAFAFPNSGALAMVTGVFLAIVTLAEVSFALWLIIRGPRRAAA
ncbi:DUF4386 domain-containing protein [Sinisalibacter aestuarii]|uniref:DUF4386 domain-containing protein n=1 Tax=Sinisalibacter aestuarii TaxID=2949426 RepID=A0ABQ5LV98_9RHOB|nr:DUF4386 domain-containing protein [Sinisalibacter aestuarii]GKY88879.1 DUF4386 domain-containing protein [Sinisalibacter aestuarii]